MERTTNIVLEKEHFKFSSGHFTIFSKDNRENLHGHNFTVAISISSKVDDSGLAFDYRLYKQQTEAICKELNEHFLLPTQSPFLTIEETDEHVFAHFNGEKIPFLKRDVILLPLANVTLEELAKWFLERFLADKSAVSEYRIAAFEVRVSSGPGQSASAYWSKK